MELEAIAASSDATNMSGRGMWGASAMFKPRGSDLALRSSPKVSNTNRQNS
jgi:hypothetical protein